MKRTESSANADARQVASPESATGRAVTPDRGGAAAGATKVVVMTKNLSGRRFVSRACRHRREAVTTPCRLAASGLSGHMTARSNTRCRTQSSTLPMIVVSASSKGRSSLPSMVWCAILNWKRHAPYPNSSTGIGGLASGALTVNLTLLSIGWRLRIDHCETRKDNRHEKREFDARRRCDACCRLLRCRCLCLRPRRITHRLARLARCPIMLSPPAWRHGRKLCGIITVTDAARLRCMSSGPKARATVKI